MRDYISLGATPCEEECAQVGSENYGRDSRCEIAVYDAQLRRLFPDIPEGCSIGSKSFPHDYGSYRECVVFFDPDIEEHVRFAIRCENESPQYWDNESRTALQEAGYTLPINTCPETL